MRPRFNDPRLRAKDADRNLAVDLINAAFSDGQLSSADRDLRIERVLLAPSLGDLEGLTRDLQDVPLGGVPATTRPGRSHRTLRIGLVAAAVLLVAGGIVGAMTGREDHSGTTPVEVTKPVTVPEPPEAPEPEPPAGPEPQAEPAPPRYSFTAAGIRNFVTLYTKEFGAPKELAFGFARHQVVIYQPSDSEGMIRRWFLRDGRWLDDGPERPRDPMGSAKVDLRKVDIDAMMRRVDDAKRSSGLKRFTTLGTTVLVGQDGPEVFVAAGTRSDCYALRTDLSGKILERGIDCSVD